jgi:hypothetical protein
MVVGLTALRSMVLATSQPEAHVHGTGKINIAVEGTQATVEFFAPAESIYGFEHAATSASEKQQSDAALQRLEKDMSRIVQFDTTLTCRFSKKHVRVTNDADHSDDPHHHDHAKPSATHSEVQAEFTVSCRKPLPGSVVRFGVTTVFPQLKAVAVQVLSESKQVGADITEDQGGVEL